MKENYVIRFEQFISSLSSAICILISSRFLTNENWGKFAALLFGYSMLVSVSQALIGENLIITSRANTKNFTTHGLLQVCIILNFAISVLIAVFMYFAFQLNFLDTVFFCIFAALLATQDNLRFLRLIDRQIRKLYLSDFTWLLLTIFLFFFIKPSNLLSVILAWGIPGLLALVGIIRKSDFGWNISSSLRLLGEINSKNKLLFFDVITGGVVNLLVILIISKYIDYHSVGVLRAFQTLFGAANVYLNTFRTVDVLRKNESGSDVSNTRKQFWIRILSILSITLVPCIFVYFLPISILSQIVSMNLLSQIKSLIFFGILERCSVAALMSGTVIERQLGRVNVSGTIRISSQIVFCFLLVVNIIIFPNLIVYFIASIVVNLLATAILLKMLKTKYEIPN